MVRLHLFPFLVLSLCMVTGCSERPGSSGTLTGTPDSSIVRLFQRSLAIRQSNPDSALVLCDLVYQQSKEKSYHKGVVDSRLTKGMILLHRGDHQEAQKVFGEGVDYAANYRQEDVGLFQVNEGLSFMMLSQWDSASRSLLDGIESLKKDTSRETDALILAYNNLANVYIKLRQKTDALRYLEEAEKFNAKLPASRRDSRTMAFVQASKAQIYLGYEIFEKAEEHFKLAVEIARKHHDRELEQDLLAGLSGVYLARKEPHRAIPLLKDALSFAATQKNTNPYNSYLAPSYSLAEAYYDLKDYSNAKRILLEAIEVADSTRFNVGQEHAHELLAKIYEAEREPWKAIAELKNFTALKDSFLAEEKQRAVNELELRYRTAEKDRTLAEKELMIERQKSSMRDQKTGILILAALAILLTALFFAIYRNIRQKQKLQNEHIRHLEAEAEISHLKAMVKGEEKERARLASELHDNIVGQLAAIKMNFSAIQHQYRLEHLTSYSEALRQLNDAADDVRKTAHNLMPAVLLQGGLFAAIRHFCRKMSPHLHINFQCFGELPRLDPEFELSCYRIVQELVQNTVKHSKAEHVMVQLNCTVDMLSMTVEDDGVGMDDSRRSSGSGLGLKNIETRISAFNGQMQIEAQPDRGTAVYIEFDLTVKNELVK